MNAPGTSLKRTLLRLESWEFNDRSLQSEDNVHQMKIWKAMTPPNNSLELTGDSAPKAGDVREDGA
jgi:hypothetical protein